MSLTWPTVLIVAGTFALLWTVGRLARTRPLLDCWLNGGLCVFLAAAAVLNAVAGNWGWTAFEGATAIIAGGFWWQSRRRRALAKNGATS